MRTSRWQALSLLALIVLVYSLPSFGSSLDEVSITFQGRLTDAAGVPVSDGLHNVSYELRDQDGTVAHSGSQNVQTTGGLFTLTVPSIGAELFYCPDPLTPCVQNCTFTLVTEGVTLPPVNIYQSGRAAFSEGVNGPNALINGPLLRMTGSAGTSMFEVNSGNNPFPVFNVASSMSTTFNGQTRVNNYLTVDPDNNGAANLQIGGGYCSGSDILYWNVPPGAGGAEFVVDNLGNIFLDPNGSAAGGIIFQNSLTFNERAVHHTMDRDNNGVADVDFQTNGRIEFNTDTDPAMEVTFGANVTSINNALAINPVAAIEKEANAGLPEVDISDGQVGLAGNVSIDANQDGSPEAIWDEFAAQFEDLVFVVDPNGDGSYEFNVKTGEIIQIGTTKMKGNVEIDPNGDDINDMIIVMGPGGAHTVISGDLEVTGNKLFVQQHPADPSKEIAYVALEGGEAGTYSRGSGALNNGVAVIDLPEHFALVTNADGLTAQITPRGPVQSMLYVESVTPTTLIVKSSNSNDASVPFDYLVNGVRRGFEHHEAIREKVQLSMRP